MPSANKTSTRRMNIFRISVPAGAETTFLRTMSRNMGWETTIFRPKKKEDPTLMSEEDFFAKIDRAKEQAQNGEIGPEFDSATELIEYIKTL